MIVHELKAHFVRKIPLPDEPEAGCGAIADDGTILLNHPLINRLGMTREQLGHQVQAVKAEIARRNRLYRKDRPLPELKNKTIILVDDGLASGFTMLAAIESARQRGTKEIIVAVPTASSPAYHRVEKKADQVLSLVVAQTPYFAVASFYERWHDLSDEEVLAVLEDRRRGKPDLKHENIV